MSDHETTRGPDAVSGEHTRPRVLYSAPPPNSRGDKIGTAQEAARSAPTFNSQQATRPFGDRSRLRPAPAREAGQALPLQRRRANASTLAKQRDPESIRGFTLAELVVTVGVLVVLVLLFTQLLKSAASVTTLGHKQMDTDSQTRQLLDRMAIDFAQMVKRSDVDYYVKSSWFATNSPTPAPTGARTLLQPGNDTIAFYSTLPGYYPSSGLQSPLSLVAYRVNSNPSSSAYNKMQRMGKGLVWNAVSTTDTPVVFMPIPLASAVPSPELPAPAATPTPSPTPAWLEIASTGSWSDSEVIGPQVFRFEYYYLLKGQTNPAAPPPTPTPYSPIFSDTPWDTRICACPTVTPTPPVTPTPGTPTPPPATPTPPSVCCHVAPEGMQDVAAVVVVIAVIDPTTKVLVTDANLARLNGADGQSQGPVLIDWGNAACAGCPTQTQWQTTPGLLGAQWRAAIDANSIGLPRPAISGIRVYERTFYLSPPTLLTP